MPHLCRPKAALSPYDSRLPGPIAGAAARYHSLAADIARLRAQPPQPAVQAALLALLRKALGPLVEGEGLSEDFTLAAGLRLRSRFGQCRRYRDGRPPELQVRCTRPQGGWRAQGAITGTLLHELAHLKHPHHGARFWACLRRLLDAAAAAGIYDPADIDPDERAQGDTKLEGSAAEAVALLAREEARRRAAANRAAIAGWEPGARARIAAKRGLLAGAEVTILARRRTRLEVETADGRRWLIPAALLMADGAAGALP